MADVTELRCWPSCLDAIDWSQDGIIALASDERVELLFPNTVSYDRDHEVPQWQHIALKVPLFSNDELPPKEPAPLPTYSVGEEISNSAPIAIAWSPSGLAKHRRCALATLTANLVLSIWSAEGKPQDESSWNRRLIVNNALAEYFLNNATEESSHVAVGFGEKLRLRTRIRAFAWAPPLPSSKSTGIIGTRLSYGQYMLAVSNDDNQIAFVVVDSPTSTLGVERSWNGEVLTHLSLMPDSESIFTEPTFFEDMMKQQRHISHIAWSPWIIRGEWYHSVVVYATNEDVRARIVTYTHDSIGLGEEVIYPDIELRNNGPMTWSPRIEEGDNLKLALFTNSGLVYLTISGHDASIVERITHDLDRRWDQVSGAIWDSARHPTLRLHFSSLLSTLQSPTALLEESSSGLMSLSSPNWRDQIENNLALFSVKNDLKGNSKTKVWGLTISPLGDFIAACNSVHPSDMIEYGPPGDRRGTIAISTLRQHNQLREAFPSRNVSAESVLFTLKKLAENTVEDADHMPAFAEELVEKLLRAYSPPHRSGDGMDISKFQPEFPNLSALLEAFKKVAFLDQHTLKDRYTVLVSQAHKTTSSSDLSKTLIAYRLATTLQDLPSSLSQMSFSAEILAHHRQLVSFIHALITPEAIGTGHSSTSDANDLVTESTHSPALITNHEASVTDLAISGPDTCDFCSAPIPFTDLTTASCTNGHSFPRCGLSFLAIQAPGITKYCGICSTPFLNEEFVAAQELAVLERNAETDIDAVMTNAAEPGAVSNSTGHTATKNVDEESNITGKGNGSGDGDEKREDQEQRNGMQGHPDSGPSNEDSVSEDESRELPITLARVLYLACDVCIYCGGKFVG